MPLETKSQEVQFRFGIDVREDSEATPQGAFDIVNYDFDKEGVLEARGGFQPAEISFNVPNGAPVAFLQPGAALTVLGQDDVARDMRTITTLSPARRVLASTIAASPTGDQSLVALTYHTEDTTNTTAVRSQLYLVDNASGRVLWVRALDSGVCWGAVPVLVEDGSTYRWAVFFRRNNGGSNDIAVRHVLPDGSMTAVVTVDTGHATELQMPFDAYQATPDQAGIVWVDSATNNVTAAFYTYAGPQAGANVAVFSGGPPDLRIQVLLLNSGYLAILWNDSGNLTVSIWDPNTGSFPYSDVVVAALGGQFPALLALGEATTDFLYVLWAFGAEETHYTTLVVPSGTVGGGWSVPGFAVSSRPKPDGLGNVIVAGFTGNGNSSEEWRLHPGIVQLQLDGARQHAVGVLSYDEAGNFIYDDDSAYTDQLPMWAGPDLSLLPVLVLLETYPKASPDYEVGDDGLVRRVRLVQQVSGTVITTRLQGTAFAAHGLLQAHDGFEYTPAAFLSAPPPPGLTLLNSGSGALTGTFNYVVVWEFVDNRGNIMLSPPSQPATVVAAAHDVSIDLVTDAAGFQQRVLRVKVYRASLVNTTFRLVGTIVSQAYFDSETLLDQEIDADLGENLYTTGGALEGELAPPFTFTWTHRNRLWGIRSDVPETVMFSNETTDPFHPRFHQVLTLRVDNVGGPPLAGASLVDKCVIFQHDQILVVAGEGPDGTGNLGAGGNGYSLPEVVARGVGVEPDQIGSVVETPMGVMFSHRKGIHLLTPDLQVVNLGDRLGGRGNGLLRAIRRARHLALRDQVWFLTDFDILVWDLRLQRWTRFIIGNGTRCLDVAEHRGVIYALFEGSNDVWRLAELDPRDGIGDIQYFSRSISLPWFRGGDRPTEMRLRKIHVTGRTEGGPWSLRVDVYTSDERQPRSSSVPTSTYTWDSSQTAQLAENWQLSLRCASQRCRAFRCTLTIIPDDGDGAPGALPILSTVTYDYGVLPGRGKGPAGVKPASNK